MKRFCIITFFIAVLATFSAATFHPGFAQSNSPQQWRVLRLHHMRPDLMAYFVDPKNQKIPVEFSIPSHSDPHFSLEDFVTTTTADAPELDFDGVLAVDAKQNALWVLSDQNTFDATKQFVDFMDRPIVQGELELQVVKINKEDLASFKTTPIPAKTYSAAPAPYQSSLLTADALETLQKLVTQGKAKVINAPRITTLNHLPGTLASATTTPVSVGIKAGDAPYTPLTFDTTDGTQIGHITQFRTSFIPHINEASNTISLELNIAENDGITSFNAKKRLQNIDPTIWFHDQLNPPLAVNLNVNDNQTILISGLHEKHEDIAIFVTTRIVRRAE